MSDLAQLAQAAGIIDVDGLQFANLELPTPAAQLADLRKRKPHFFPQHASKMSPAEYRAALAEATKPRPATVGEIAGGKHASQMTDREYQRAKADAGLRSPSLMRGLRR